MTEHPTDILWPHFAPLWTDLREIAPGILLTGGYALFLKQKWLLSPAGIAMPTLVTISRWNDQTPRVTKDLDFVVEVDLIASPGEQRRLHSVLTKRDFNVVEGNERWQFQKKLGGDKAIIVDFHAPVPVNDRKDVRVEARRVKPKPGLGHFGIHGRQNAEAIGSNLFPFHFMLDHAEIVIPNAVTMAVMKLVAMRDRWQAARDDHRSAQERDFDENQARKHAQDLFRATAMITREESDHIATVIDAVRGMGTWADAAGILQEFFGDNQAWGTRIIAPWWREEDGNFMRDTLSAWFR